MFEELVIRYSSHCKEKFFLCISYHEVPLYEYNKHTHREQQIDRKLLPKTFAETTNCFYFCGLLGWPG